MLSFTEHLHNQIRRQRHLRIIVNRYRTKMHWTFQKRMKTHEMDHNGIKKIDWNGISLGIKFPLNQTTRCLFSFMFLFLNQKQKYPSTILH